MCASQIAAWSVVKKSWNHHLGASTHEILEEINGCLLPREKKLESVSSRVPPRKDLATISGLQETSCVHRRPLPGVR